jgi:hypothetical protein
MRRLVFLAVASILPLAALAQNGKTTVTVSRTDCANLVEHTPSADVAYKPGVDVRGKAVAPADLGGGVQLAMPEEVTIAIEIDLAARYGLPSGAAANLYKPTASMGTVSYKNGKAFFNGQPLTNAETEALAEACRKVR